MLWKTIGDILEEDFRKWCVKVMAEPTPRSMIEYLAANGYLKIRKLATEYKEEDRLPSFEFIDRYKMPLREGFLPPAMGVWPKERKKKNADKSEGPV